jgi:NAD dependent epimerase/dehydratase family enzyme
MSALGVINGTAPNPVRLSELCEQLGNVLGRPSWLPVPDFALKAVLGEGATVVRSHLWLTCPPSIYTRSGHFYKKQSSF